MLICVWQINTLSTVYPILFDLACQQQHGFLWQDLIALRYRTIEVLYVFVAAGLHGKINGCFVYDTEFHIWMTGFSSTHYLPTSILHNATITHYTRICCFVGKAEILSLERKKKLKCEIKNKSLKLCCTLHVYHDCLFDIHPIIVRIQTKYHYQ